MLTTRSSSSSARQWSDKNPKLNSQFGGGGGELPGDSALCPHVPVPRPVTVPRSLPRGQLACHPVRSRRHYGINANAASAAAANKHTHAHTHTHTHMFVKTSEWRPLWETAEWRPGQLLLNIEAKCSYSAYGFLEPRKPRLHDFKMRRLNKSKSAKYSGVTAGGYDVTMTSLYFTHPKWRPVVTSRCTGLHTPHLAFAARINIPIV